MPSTIKAKEALYAGLWTIFLILLDQASKALVRQEMELGESIPVLEGIFHLTYIENKGAAFGVFSHATELLALFSIVFILLLWVLFIRSKKRPPASMFALSMITAGGIGNLIDRLFRGSVTDMFDLRIWPIFNVADIAVSLGVLLLMVLLLRYEDDDHA